MSEIIHKDMAIFPKEILDMFTQQGISELRPAQDKSLAAGLLRGKSLLVCTPTASGKTFVAELAFLNTILNKKKTAIYTVPLKALATEKFRDFTERYSKSFRIGMSIGDYDSFDSKIGTYDLVITTNEKLDSLLRHDTSWLDRLGLVVFDEIHLLNDPSRGPTLEVVITLLRKLVKNIQILGLSATIGNPEELADWLDAALVMDDWRPVKLKKGTLLNHQLEFEE